MRVLGAASNRSTPTRKLSSDFGSDGSCRSRRFRRGLALLEFRGLRGRSVGVLWRSLIPLALRRHGGGREDKSTDDGCDDEHKHERVGRTSRRKSVSEGAPRQGRRVCACFGCGTDRVVFGLRARRAAFRGSSASCPPPSPFPLRTFCPFTPWRPHCGRERLAMAWHRQREYAGARRVHWLCTVCRQHYTLPSSMAYLERRRTVSCSSSH